MIQHVSIKLALVLWWGIECPSTIWDRQWLDDNNYLGNGVMCHLYLKCTKVTKWRKEHLQDHIRCCLWQLSMHWQVLYFKIWIIDEDVHDNIMQQILVLVSKPTYDLHILQCLASMHRWYLHALMGFTHVSQEHIVELRFIMSFECVCFKTVLPPLYHSKCWAEMTNSACCVILWYCMEALQKFEVEWFQSFFENWLLYFGTTNVLYISTSLLSLMWIT